MPTLRELEGEFLVHSGQSWRAAPNLAGAQGVKFLCPKCYAKNGGPAGTHMVVCWFRGSGVPDDAEPGPGRWNPHGSGLDDLTFVGPGAFSVQLNGGCNWHGNVAGGSAS